MHFDSIAFDLDGTLWDTCPTCAEVWNEVAARLGIEFQAVTADDVRRVAGRSHVECMKETFKGVAEDTLQQLTELTMVEDNARIAARGGEYFAGVRETIPALAQRRLVIVSNCQSGYIEIFLRQSGLASHFVDVECWGNTGKSKSENLRALIERNKLRRTLMVGDTEGDERAARDCGVAFAFAAYGFGRVRAPDFVLGAFGELVKVVG